ncbi:DUF2585 family protein [soil metagenome]
MDSPAQSNSSVKLFTARLVGILILVLIVHAVTLHLMGRIPWCKCGFGLWTFHAWTSETSQMFADPYSATHVLHGIIFYAVLWLVMPRTSLTMRFWISVAIEVAWEVVENTPFVIDRYRDATAALDYTGDSMLNSVGDVLSAVLGFWVAARLPWKATLALVLAIEVLLLVTIRDNLTLNVVMILHPIEAIKEWQTGG